MGQKVAKGCIFWRLGRGGLEIGEIQVRDEN